MPNIEQPPISPLRRKTKMYMLIAAIITGVPVVLPIVIVLFGVLMGDIDRAAKSMTCFDLCAFVPLCTTAVLLRFRNAVGQGSETASKTVKTMAVVQVVYSVVLAFLMFVVVGMSPPGFEAFFTPFLCSTFLAYILGGIACWRVNVLLGECSDEDSQRNPRYMRHV